MEEITEYPEPSYFGDCPECGGTDGYLNIGRGHWFFCDKHKTKWFIGSNLFSSWKDETEEEWRKNFEKLAHYQEVKPLHRCKKSEFECPSGPMPGDFVAPIPEDDLPF